MKTATLGQRVLFDELKTQAYLNHAAISPASQAVRQAVEDVLLKSAQYGVDAFADNLDLCTALRKDLALLIGAPDEYAIALGPNTTTGLTQIAMSIPWKQGDRIIISRGEFPANVTPWQRAAELFDLEIVFLPQPELDLSPWFDALNAQLKKGARLLALSAVQFQTGLLMPLNEIGKLCQQFETELAVDAIQACGVVPMDVLRSNIDYLSAGSHKWLMGIPGSGFLFVNGERAKTLKPHLAGWLSHENALSFLFEGSNKLSYKRPFQKNARFFEVGMANIAGAAALRASVGTLLTLGIDAIISHVNQYLNVLEEAVIALGFKSLRAKESQLRSGILSFDAPKDVDVVALHRRIHPSKLSVAIPDGRLRFSPHFHNNPSEIPSVIAELERALGECRSS